MVLSYKGEIEGILEKKDLVVQTLIGKKPATELQKSQVVLLKKILDDIEIIEKAFKSDKEKFSKIKKASIFENNRIFNEAEEANLKSLFAKMKDDYRFLENSFPHNSFYCFFFTSNFFFMVNSTLNSLTEMEKRNWTHNFFLIEREKFKGPEWNNNAVLRFEKSRINVQLGELANDDMATIMNLIMNFEKEMKERFGQDNPANIAIHAYKIKALYLRNKKQEAISILKTIPFEWQVHGNPRTSGNLFDINYYSYLVYRDLGEPILSKAYLEGAFSVAFADNHSKIRIKKIATLLRDEHFQDRNLILMRNLEERCAKFGLEPLPKQPGEN